MSTKATRHWIVVRFIECRLQTFVQPDSWDDLGMATWTTDNREAAFQKARELRGLLVAADGLPSSKQLFDWHSAVEAASRLPDRV